jgi:cardiolipin synthase A/B
MQELLDAITDLAANSPPAKIQQLATLLRSDSASLGTAGWATTPAARTRLDRFVAATNALSMPRSDLAGMLLGASHAYHKAKSEESVDLIWTGPSSELVATRKTEQALLQVIQAAKSKLFLTSFVAYQVTSIIEALDGAMKNGVALSMLLESAESHGGGISFDVIGMMRKALPSAKIYFWGDKPEAFVGGRVHAKVAVADERICFISSANLTGHAMEKNMEAGVLIEGGALPSKLHRHLEALVTTKQLASA